nr:MAG TPA: hypothetical protein [Caudoviricetes sp.]
MVKQLLITVQVVVSQHFFNLKVSLSGLEIRLYYNLS